MAKIKPYDSVLGQKTWRAILPPMESDKPFAEIAARVQWHRALLGLNQADYAKKAGIKRSQLSNWESGMQRVSVDGALALRRTYGLSLDFIYEGIDDALPMTLRQALLDSPRVNDSR